MSLTEVFAQTLADEKQSKDAQPSGTLVETVKAEPLVEDKKVESIKLSDEEKPEKVIDNIQDEPVKSAEKDEVKTIESKDWWDEDESSLEKKTEKAEEGKKQDEALVNKAKEYDTLLQDPFFEALIEAKRAGKDLSSVLNEIKDVDYDKLTPEDLYRIELKKEGLSDDDFDAEMERFAEMTPLQKKRETNAIKSQMQSEHNERIKKYSLDGKKQLAKQTEIVNKGKEELKSFTSDLVGKDYYGVKVTPEIADGINQYVSNEFSIYKEDGSFNISKLAEFALWDKYKKVVMKTNIDKARNSGREEILDAVSRPSKNITENRLPSEHSASKDDVQVSGFMGRFKPQN